MKKIISSMKQILLHKRLILTSILIIGIIIGIVVSLVIYLPLILHEVQEPYFIIIKNNEDLEFWSSSGNGTVNNPYIIEGHHIVVPENEYEKDYDTPCIPEESVISISGVSKSFIIQNNFIDVKGGCEGQYIIKISDISVHFAICNNELRGGFYAHAFSLSNVDGRGSIITNNRINSAGTYLDNVHNVSFIDNQFYTRGNAYGVYVFQSSNIFFNQNYCFLYCVTFRECSYIFIDKNILENNDIYSGWTLLYIRETEYCSITNNTFIRGGLTLRCFDAYYPTVIVASNIVNGKPLGFLYKQSDVIIDGTTKYGQIMLVNCNNSIITDQVITETSSALIIKNCTETTVANGIFSHCGWTGINVESSTKTSILDCYFEDNYGGVLGKGSYSFIVKRNLFRMLMCGIYLEECTSLVQEDNVFEDVDREITIWN